jgi:DUF971 family protein
MPQPPEYKVPAALNLNRAARVLELDYGNGERYALPCEYLRVHTPSVEVRGIGELVTGKEGVNIDDIQPVGNYAVRLYFDDGHKSGVYSWETLYALATHYADNWKVYLARLKEAGNRRQELPQ